MAGTASIHEFLRETRAAYTVLPHRAAFSAQEEAAALHVPGRGWAKVVVCFVEGVPIQAVIPAPLTVNLDRFLEIAGGTVIRLAQEDELRRLYPGCEPGAMPPFGPLYGQQVFVDTALTLEPEIVFNAGTYTEAIRMPWGDFAACVKPIVGSFAEPPLDEVGSFRLSPLE